MKDADYEILIPERTRQWLIQCVPCYIARDFAGYIFILDERKKIGGMITLNGDFLVYSLDERKPELTDRERRRVYKKLFRSGFIYEGIQPFPELKHIPNNPANTFIIHEYLFQGIK